MRFKEIIKEYFQSDIIRIDGLDLFLSNFSMFVLFILNNSLNRKIIYAFKTENYANIIFIIILFLNLLGSIYYTLYRASKDDVIKVILWIWFSYINIYSIMGALLYYSDNNIPVNKLIVFLAVFEIFYFLGIVREYFLKEYGEVLIAEDKHSYKKIVINSIIIVMIIIILEFYFQYYWAETFIFCVSYIFWIEKGIPYIFKKTISNIV